MRLSRQRWRSLSADERQRITRRAAENIDAVVEQVRPIVEAVRKGGDRALRELTLKFDGVDLHTRDLLVGAAEYDAAERSLDRGVRSALEYAMHNVRRYHAESVPTAIPSVEVRPGLSVSEKVVPIDSVGLYVPRGRGSFPSMVYMAVIPAFLAGVPHIAVATPPGPDGGVDPACLVAARLAGAHRVYRVGGAQAIAALAFGTETFRAVTKLSGPGSVYVAAAKRLVGGLVDTGIEAGPSESVIVADESASPLNLALDLLIEAEHGADSASFLVTPSASLADAVEGELAALVPSLPEPRRGFVRAVLGGEGGGVILTDDLDEAFDVVDSFATEHLSVQTLNPESWLPRIRHAGEVLLGPHTPFSLANYVAGANAILPTGGRARSSSALSVVDFVRRMSIVKATRAGFDGAAAHVAALADYEGFPAHAAAIRRRV